MNLKKILIICLLLFLTVGTVNASENIDSLQTVENSQNNMNTYEIDDTNYDTYSNLFL